MGWAEMVVAIVAIGAIGSVLRAKYGVGKDRQGNEFRYDDSGVRQENEQLKTELRGLKERIAVLERLATDSNDSGARLDREIEKLRDRP